MSFLGKFFQNVNKKEAISWALYDFGNSAYAFLFISFVFPIFFKEVVVGNSSGDFWWGFAISVSILFAGIFSPIIGAIADFDSKRKRKFIFLALFSMIGIGLLYFSEPNTLFLTIWVFILTNLAFQLALTLYDSFLVQISSKETSGRISGLGSGLGYLGGIIVMLLLRPLYSSGYSGMNLYKLTLPLIALFFLIFSLPAFIFLKDTSIKIKKKNFFELTKIGFSKTFNTIKSIKKHKSLFWFLIAFYLMNDGLVAFIAFITIYAKTTFGLSMSKIMVLLFLVQIIAFPASIFFGWLSDKMGSKKILLSTIGLWAIVILLLSIVSNEKFFNYLTIVIGLILGSSQAIARSWFSKLVPKRKQCEFFGFNGFASKIAAMTAPLLFGIISSVSGNQRIAMATLAIYFIIAFMIFIKIPENVTNRLIIK